ncbi:helix-turn-helix transcriptional regulator [Micromonospora sp. DT81.3]|uniref:helix-turn-helix transcriptional regulator n=1 Tax=Micromonospora sp. DT81.3 TaxID=3416523 RepID=UPI003CF94B69
MKLLGRQDERAHLMELIREGPRLIGISGRAGVGKSALLASLADAPPEGADVWKVDLHEAGESGLCEGIVRRLGVAVLAPSGADYRPVERVVRVIGGTPVVLALDHVPERTLDTPETDELLDSCPNLRVVVATSTRVLDATENIALQPLHVPPPGASFEEALACPSVALFIDRATSAYARFRVEEKTIDAVAEICRLVGGLPLAIELAAARIRMLSPERLAVELSDATAALDLLSPGSHTQRMGLRQAIAATFGTLRDHERLLLGRLSCFSGPFPFEAAVAVGGQPYGDVADGLEKLTDLRLIDPDEPASGEAVYSMLPIMRRFIAESGIDADAAAVRRTYLEGVLRDADLAVSRATRTSAVIHAHTLRRDLVDEGLRRFASDAGGSAAWLTACAAQLVGSAESVIVGELLERLIETREVDALPRADRARVWLWSSNALAFSPDGAAMAELIRERWGRGADLIDVTSEPLLALQSRSIAVTNGVTTGDLSTAVLAAREGARLALSNAFPTWAARFEVLDAAAVHATGDVTAAVRLALAALRHAERVGDLEAIVGATIVLRTVPLGGVPGNAALPSLTDLLALARSQEDVVRESFLLGALTRIELSEGRAREAAHWCAERLAAGAARGWSYLLTISLVHATLIAATLGDLPFAARILGALSADRERVLRAMAPATTAQLERTSAMADSRLGAAHVAALRAGGALLTLSDASAEVVRWLRRHAAHVDHPVDTATGEASLTPREREVLSVLAEGWTNQQIAAHLHISVKTTMHHSVAIYRKLAVRGRAEATAYAHRHGMVRSDSPPA